MNLPIVKFKELDQSSVPESRKDTLHGLILQTKFGQDDKPYKVMSLDQFKRLFGGYNALTAPYFPQLKRALARGVGFYVQRLVAANAAAATYDFATHNVSLTATSKGSWPNTNLGFTLQVTPTFKLTLTYADDPSLNEVFEAVTLVDLADLVNHNSRLVNMTLGAGYTTPDAVAVVTYLAGGSDGSFADTAAKDSAINALYPKFDSIVDIDTLGQLCTFTKAGVYNLQAYVEARKDLMGIAEVDPTLSIAQAKTFMTDSTTGIGDMKSNFMAVYFGTQLSAWSVEAQADVKGPIMLDVMSVWSQSDTLVGNRLKAPAGPNRGLIDGVKDFDINLLSPAKLAEVNELVDTSLNIVGNHPQYGPVVWGAKTLNRNNSALANIHVVRLVMDLRRNLAPGFQLGLFETNEPTAWRQMYLKSKPILDALVTAKAIAPAYQYIGDQNVSRLSEAVYNQAADLANGIYKVKIAIVPYGYIEEVDVTTIINSVLGTVTAA